jgi:outer membrane protein assembly factor BamB
VIPLLWLAFAPFDLERPGNPEAPLGPTLSTAPVLKWQRPLPGGQVASATHTERGRPVALADNVYLGSAGGDALYQLHRGSGAVLHAYPAKAAVQSAASVTEEGIFFSDLAGYTYRYAHGSDEAAWEHFGGAPISATPLVYAEILVVATVDDLVYALDQDTGELQWRYQRPPDPARVSDLTLFGAPSPREYGGQVLVGFSDGALVALNADNGSLEWELSVGEGRYPDLIGAPVTDDDSVYVSGYSAPLVAVDVESHAIRWRLPFGSADAPALHNDWLYHPGTDGKLRKVYARTGELVWTWDSETTGALTTPQLTPAGVLVSSSDGGLYLVSGETGETVWTYETDHVLDGVTVAPLVVGSQVLAVTNGGNLLALGEPRHAVGLKWLKEPF